MALPGYGWHPVFFGTTLRSLSGSRYLGPYAALWFFPLLPQTQMGWNEDAFIRQIEFFQNDTLKAVLYMEIVTLAPGKGKITTTEVFAKSGIQDPKPHAWPEAVLSWSKN